MHLVKSATSSGRARAASMKHGTAGVILVLLALAGASAPAAALPVAQFYVVVPNSPGVDPARGGTARNSISNTGGSYSGMASSFGPSPTLALSFTHDWVAAAGPGLTTEAGLSYYFEVIGTTPQPLADAVPLDLRMIGSLLIQATGQANADIYARVELSRLFSTVLFTRRACVHSSFPFPCPSNADPFETIDNEVTFFVEPGAIYQLSMQLLAQTSFGGPGGVQVFATLDPLPVFSDMDPTILGLPADYSFADEFAIAFSPGVGTPEPAAVPAPAGATLLVLGAAMLAARRYVRLA
jgi:hypothetical protein